MTVTYKEWKFDNNLERSLARLYTLAIQASKPKDCPEVVMHFSYLHNWIKKHGGDIP